MMTPTQTVQQVAQAFGVNTEQAERDLLISHVLAALSMLTPDAVFYGGTAIARTYLPNFRLSEDIDLFVTPRQAAVQRIEGELPGMLSRDYGKTQWLTLPSSVRESGDAFLAGERGAVLKLQVGEYDDERRRWPVEARKLDLRFNDLPATVMRVPTSDGFVAMKVAAWDDRHAARDLADLWALNEVGLITENAEPVIRHALGRSINASSFRSVPPATLESWEPQLAHQMAEVPDPEMCRRDVYERFATLLGW
jgi:predicted nucleotidyltransferase component of viral defense system